jgi:uncharacterized protein YbaP (TraB family)
MPSLLSFALLLLLSLAAVAGDAGHPVSMWLVQGDSNRLYLLGSVHLLRREDHPLPRVIGAAYDDADELYMEIDMDDVDPLAMQATINRLGLLDGNESLRDVMGEELYAEALIAARAVDIPLEMLEKAEPWFAALTVEQLALTRIGFNPAHGIEMYMLSRAGSDGKPVHGFETIEQQLGLLDGLSLDAQRNLLMQTLEESANISEVMDQLIEAWRTGNSKFLEDQLLAEIVRYPELYETIVADRNRDWVNTIDILLGDDQDYLVIVGALHLVGEDGVPALLEQRGFSVSQMHEPNQGQGSMSE